jgi:hypothetical protein
MQVRFARKIRRELLSNAHLSRVSCDCEQRGASAQKLHNNPEFLPGSAEQAANGQAITATVILRSRALARRLEGSAASTGVCGHPSRLAEARDALASRGEHLRMAVDELAAARESDTQMISIAATTPRLPLLLDSIPRKLIVALAVTGFADWLFYDQKIGISLAVFLLVLGGLSLLTNPVHAGLRQWLLAAAVFMLGLAAVIEEFNVLSATLAVLAVAVAISSLTNPLLDGLRARYAAVQDLLLTGPFRIFADIAQSPRWVLTLKSFTVWVVPLFLSCVFLVLFSSANPLIETWLNAIDLKAWLSRLSVVRLLFWSVTLCVVWPFIYLKWICRSLSGIWVYETEPAEAESPEAEQAPSELFGAAAILRSLLLFNLLFALQTTLDVIYLWGGVALPDELTYAAYAHRGAYPLIVTALLAAGFVLAAMRPGGPAERLPAVRVLVFLWVAQNVMLVVSSMLRLDLYVQIYSLTYWRVAAFIWMLLVAAGLILIVARIAFDRSNSWLVQMNLATLALTACISAFINFPYVIASYNVDHSKEVSGNGLALDVGYLVGLGPQAVPAIDRYLAALPNGVSFNRGQLAWNRDQLIKRQLAELDSWRAWSFRGYRLKRYVTAGGTPPVQEKAAAAKGDKG